MSSGRRAVTAGSFWRTAPAAALRGVAKVAPAAAARRAADEAPPLVEERHAEAVDLRLADVREPGAGDRAADARLELAQVAGARGVVEREHRPAVFDGLEQVGRGAPDALGGAVVREQVGERRLEVAKLAHEPVVLRVGDLGSRLDVVAVVVVVDPLAALRA